MMLKMLDQENLYPTAKFISKDKIDSLEIFTPILNVGAGSGRPPYPSIGVISQKYMEDAGLEFLWQISAPSIYGKSGCGVFTMDDYSMLGIVVRGGVSRGGMIEHQCFIVPADTIWEWCKKEKLEFVLKG